MITLGQAIAIASEAHKDQLDKGGKPYILHCLEVMNNVKHKTEDYKIVAILHNLIEDKDWFLRKEIYSKYYLTHKILDKSYELSNNMHEALTLLTKTKNQKYDDYILSIGTNLITTRIKLADLKHNSDITKLNEILDKDFTRLKKYNRSYTYLSERYNILKEEALNVYAINDKAMYSEMLNDLSENYNYNKQEAEEWIEEFGSSLVSGMWDEYSHFMEENAIFKDKEENNE